LETLWVLVQRPARRSKPSKGTKERKIARPLMALKTLLFPWEDGWD
jgi:hypothetical protein